MNFKNSLKTVLVVMALALTLAACNSNSGKEGSFASVPAGGAYAEGQEVYFTHTEASDPEIAAKLTDMMKSPVLLVPSLAKAPEEMLANVYVFENGIAGKGPLNFQPDVFDNPPGTPGYTPLRRIILVHWKDAAKARLLKSAGEVLAAESGGELTLTKSEAVVNMPFIVWPGGQR